MSTDGQLIDFERADAVTPMIYPPQPRLVVSGQKPYPGMEVSLVPLRYVSQPPYWGIQVVGTPPGGPPQATQLPSAIPYTVELDLEGIVGSTGVEVIGASKTEQIAVPT
jgi:hypothetical protein